MTEYFEKLRKQIYEKTRDLKRDNDELRSEVARCPHKWSIIPDFLKEGGYMISGDPPGTMGVDRRLPFYVEPTVKKRWKRECGYCGEVQYTTDVIQHTTEEPTFH